jgi:hypothetical protein
MLLLRKHCTETKHCSLIHGPYVYVLLYNATKQLLTYEHFVALVNEKDK